MRKVGVLRFREHRAKPFLACNLWEPLATVFLVVLHDAWNSIPKLYLYKG